MQEKDGRKGKEKEIGNKTRFTGGRERTSKEKVKWKMEGQKRGGKGWGRKDGKHGWKGRGWKDRKGKAEGIN